VPERFVQDDGEDVPSDEGMTSAGLLVWTGETERRVRDIMADQGGERSERDAAVEWLIGYVTDEGGEASAKEVKEAARGRVR
jgi:hypothetical protein